MDLMPSPEEEQIVDAARALLADKLPVDYLRWEKGAAAAPDRAMLSTFAELGWIALGLPEDAGGFGFGATEEALLFREAGRALVTPQLLAAVVAARIASRVGDVPLAEALIAGTVRVGLAVPADDADGIFLIDADGVDRIVLVTTSGISLVTAAAALGRVPIRSVDETVTLEKARLDSGGGGIAADASGQAHLSLLIAAMLVGSAEAVRDMTVSHAGERAQFGQKIGTFQAVSHPLADMAVRCEAALAQMKVAAISLRDGGEDAGFQIGAARIVALDAALTNAQGAVQLHGGMGFTAEYPVHFHLKRAHLLDQIGGAMADQLDRFFEAA